MEPTDIQQDKCHTSLRHVTANCLLFIPFLYNPRSKYERELLRKCMMSNMLAITRRQDSDRGPSRKENRVASASNWRKNNHLQSKKADFAGSWQIFNHPLALKGQEEMPGRSRA